MDDEGLPVSLFSVTSNHLADDMFRMSLHTYGQVCCKRQWKCFRVNPRSFGSGSVLRLSSFLVSDNESIAAFGRRAAGILTEILRNRSPRHLVLRSQCPLLVPAPPSVTTSNQANVPMANINQEPFKNCGERCAFCFLQHNLAMLGTTYLSRWWMMRGSL